MSLGELGAIGEFIGAIIITVSLIYIAIQNRQNHKLLQSNGFAARAASLIDLYKSLALSEQMSGVVVKGEAGEALSPAERQQLRFLNYAYFRQIENVYFQLELGIFEGDPIDRLEAVRQRLRADRYFREDYALSENQYNLRFREFMATRVDAP